MKLSHAGALMMSGVFVGSFAGCFEASRHVTADTRSSMPPTITKDIEETIKSTTLQGSSISRPKNLKIERQTDYERGSNGPFVYPVSLAASNDSGVYVSDNNAHAILFQPPDAGSATAPVHTQGGSRLVWPNTIQIWRNSLFISDNEGIKVFGRDGSFQRLMKTYYGINNFTIGIDGKIYINPRFRNQKSSNPLIVQVDSQGTRIQAFGDRVDNSNHGDLDDQAYLCASPDVIVAVFKHRPIVYVYNLKGKLLRQFSLNHPVFGSLAALTANESFIHPEPNKFRLPLYVAGARLVGNRLLVLLHLPDPEIVELNLKGEELNRYKANGSFSSTGYRGFDAHRSGDTYHFWVLSGDIQKLVLLEFTAFRKSYHSVVRGGGKEGL